MCLAQTLCCKTIIFAELLQIFLDGVRGGLQIFADLLQMEFLIADFLQIAAVGPGWERRGSRGSHPGPTTAICKKSATLCFTDCLQIRVSGLPPRLDHCNLQKICNTVFCRLFAD